MTETTTPQAVPSPWANRTKHDPTHYVEVEFQEGRDRDSLKPAVGHLGVGHDGTSGIFGEVFNVRANIPEFTMRRYRVDEYLRLDRMQTEGLMLDAGSSRNMVFVPAEQVRLALDALPDPDSPGFSLSGMNLAPPVTERTVSPEGAAAADAATKLPADPKPAKDRYEIARDTLVTQSRELAAHVSQWNPHNEAVKPKIEAYSKMVTDVDTFLATALEKASGDRDRAAALFEQTSDRFEPQLVQAGARRPEVSQFVAPASGTPEYAPTSLQPTRDTSLDNVEPTF